MQGSLFDMTMAETSTSDTASMICSRIWEVDYVDDADSVENPAVRPLIDPRLWTLRAATSKSSAEDVESGRTEDRKGS